MNQQDTTHPLVGRRVMNKWREDCDTPEHIRQQNRGTITGVLKGCNPLVYVKFDQRTISVGMVQRDLKFADTKQDVDIEAAELGAKPFELEIGRIDGFRFITTQVRAETTKRVRGKTKAVRARFFNKVTKRS